MTDAAVDPGAPAPPHPAGVVDLARYRGRADRALVVSPPPRLAAVDRAPLPRPAETREVAIRRVRVRSVMRMAFGLALCAAAVVIGAGVLLWLLISSLGVVENVERFAEDLGWVDVEFYGPAMLRSAAITAGVLVVAATILSGVFAEVFNLLSAMTGGLRAEVGPPRLSRRQRRRVRRALAERSAKR